MFIECLLGDVDREVGIREAIPFKGRSKEEVGVSHEVSGEFVVEKSLEAGLLCILFREEDKVVDVQAHVDFVSGGQRVCAIIDDD